MFRPVVLLALTLSLLAAAPDSDIRKVLDDQVLAWNRGDIPAFMTGYENSPNTTFVGSDISKGYDVVLERYKQKYPSKEKMGTLRFSIIDVQMLGSANANVIGRFHLDRTKDAGGEANGIFTLLFKKTPSGWKIIQDHTS